MDIQASLLAVIHEEAASAAILLKVLEEENQWLAQRDPGLASPFLKLREGLLKQLMALGKKRVGMLRQSSPEANMAMAKLADLILRVQDLTKRNETLVATQLQGLERALKEQHDIGARRVSFLQQTAPL